MLTATTVTNKEELLQILELNRQNLKQNLTAETQQQEGFITWPYTFDVLEKMHALAPSVIVKDGDTVAGYALTTLKESRLFHADLETMFHNLGPVLFNGRPLSSYNYYCMGQICVAKEYRGLGIVDMLYAKHKELYAAAFDFILTEISTRNRRSVRAHEKVGFKTIYTYTDKIDEWNVVVWDWS